MNLLKILSAVEVELNCCKVEVPELGVQYVAELSGTEADKLADWWTAFKEKEEIEDNADFRRACVVFCMCDDKRQLLCADLREFTKCIDRLRVLPNSVTESLFTPANDLNGFLGVNPETKKSLLASVKMQRSDDGNGESQ